MTDILRDAWKFDGYVFSDYEAIDMLASFHRTAETLADAGAQALKAGMDLEAPKTHAFGEPLLRLVKEGKLDGALIDRAAKAVLAAKLKMGLFEKDFPGASQAAATVRTPRHLELAREMARQSVVLLKNERNILPLDPAIRSIDYGIGWGNDTGKPATCGEGYDCTDLGLSGVQEDLLERILQVGKPVVVLIFFLSGMG